MTTTGNGEEYRRGRAQGETDTTLAAHEKHLLAINGSVKDSAAELAGLRVAINGQAMQIQRMVDAMEAARQTVLTTAAALESERSSTATALDKRRDKRRDASDRRWSPWARVSATLGAIAAAVGATVGILTALHHP